MKPVHDIHTFSTQRTLTMVLVLFLSVLLSSVGHAQQRIVSPKATISGDLSKLMALRSQVRAAPCASHRCRFSTEPINLTLRVRGHTTLQISFREVRDPRFIHREHLNQSTADDAERPLLLRGSARIRHRGEHGETTTIPVAGTLFFTGDATYLEISLLKSSHRDRQSQGLLLVRAPLSSQTTVSARALRSSPFAFRDMMCATESPTSTRHTEERVSNATFTSRAAYDTLYVATDFDAAWYSAMECQSSSDCNNKIISLVNRTALFYEQQLGITVVVARQYGPTNHSTTTNASDLLYDFRGFNESNRSSVLHDGMNSGENLVDLFQLYTGRTMSEKVVGVAFTGVMCRDAASTAAHMVVGHKSDTADPVIAAHELGHTLNAGHSASGIMTAVLSSNLPSSFSSVSVSEMIAHYNTYKFECRGGTSAGAPPSANPDPTPQASPTPTPSPPQPIPQTLKLSVTKKGTNTYTVKTTVSSLRTRCYVRVRAGESEEDASTGTVILSYIPRSRTTSRKGIVNGSIATTKRADAMVYITAEYQCPGDAALEYSPFVSISPNSGKRSSPKVTRRQWISLLDKAL